MATGKQTYLLCFYPLDPFVLRGAAQGPRVALVPDPRWTDPLCGRVAAAELQCVRVGTMSLTAGGLGLGRRRILQN